MAQELWTPEKWIRQFEMLDNSKSPAEKFRDFCEMAYCAYAKLTAPTTERADALEARYMRIVETYRDKDTVRAYPEFMAQAQMNVENGRDFLCEVSGQLSVLNAKQGQFFTPQAVCRMMAKMTLSDVKDFIDKQGYVTMQEPAAGSGGLVLAAADEVLWQGYRPDIHLLVHAIDISQLCFFMCFLQLTWKGVAAWVERGNALSLEHFEGAWTPHAYMFRQHHGHLFDNITNEPHETHDGNQSVRIPDEAHISLRQLSFDFGEIQ
jgi:type I restriction-modification system DNA methylase subunit